MPDATGIRHPESEEHHRMDAPARRAHGRLAAAARWSPAEQRETRAQEHATERWRSRVAEIVAEAPPLSDEQRDHIRALLAPVIIPTTEAAA